MLRFIFATSLSCVLLICSGSASVAQSQPRSAPAGKSGRAKLQNGPPVRTASAQAAADNRAPAAEQPLDPAMNQLLEDWARSSAKIRRLECEHNRRVYDSTFRVEKLSHGKVYFEYPDKGRIDVIPTEITRKMIDDRLSGRVPAKKAVPAEGGEPVPFELQSDVAEKWICDGRMVYEIKEESKEVQAGQLPPQLQGTNIMESPLPFLFGMPPEKARRRYQLEFLTPYDPASGEARISARPLQPQDAQSWSRADIILDLKTFLPRHVRLIDTAGTTEQVYSFIDFKVNESDWLKLTIPGLNRNNIFKPDLRGYQVVMLGTEATLGNNPDERGKKGADLPRNERLDPAGTIVPNVQGMAYQDAVVSLERIGLQRREEEKTIKLRQGPAARNPEEVYTVQSQDPPPGTRIKPGAAVTLTIWDKLKTAEATGQK